MVLQKISHPNIIKILGFNRLISQDHEKYTLTVLIPLMKCSLSDLLLEKQKNGEIFTFEELTGYMKQAIDVLLYLETVARVAHRDIKTDNFLIND
jgi:serine/threonine protein kinase